MFRLMIVLSLGFVFLVSGSACGSKNAENSGNVVNPTPTPTPTVDPNIVNTYEADDVTVVCSNSLTGELFEIPYEIKATSTELVLEGIPVELTLTGTASFPSDLLNQALGLWPELDRISLEAIQATFVVRSGATGGPVVVGSSIPTGEDILIPLVNDFDACAAVEVYTPPCVIEPMEFELSKSKGTFTPGDQGTKILIGLDESKLPRATVDFVDLADPLGPNGMRVKVTVEDPENPGETVDLTLGLECYMAKLNDNGTPNPFDDFSDALPDGALMEVPIE